ncbi:MAG: ribulose-phosphate 3-epimerase [Spirochaetaceae bacterium]|nr:MAG: ribulose-phosphate 3-epimerase [Spirochaetaceae bacterium]
MMCADMIDLSRDLNLFETHGVELLHMDIMDGHYVPNVALGPQLCGQIARASSIPQDIHLMVEETDRFVPIFVPLAPRYISFHPETSRHPVRTIQSIRNAGIRPGIALDPAVTLESVMPLLGEVDLVCVMTVSPGYAGQAIIPWTIDKIRDLAELRKSRGYRYLIEVDGNVSWKNIPLMVDAGAEILVLGTSSLFQPDMDRDTMLRRLKEMPCWNGNGKN